MNRTGGQPRKATITLRLDGHIKSAATYYARQRHVPLAEVVRNLLADYVDACADENEQAVPDLLGAKPGQFTSTPFQRIEEPPENTAPRGGRQYMG